MELRDCKFCHSGQRMNFSVFSKDSCRSKYLDNIYVPFVQVTVDVYKIEPRSRTQWILIKQTAGSKENLRLFTCKGKKITERKIQYLLKTAKDAILQKFPCMTSELNTSVAA